MDRTERVAGFWVGVNGSTLQVRFGDHLLERSYANVYAARQAKVDFMEAAKTSPFTRELLETMRMTEAVASAQPAGAEVDDGETG